MRTIVIIIFLLARSSFGAIAGPSKAEAMTFINGVKTQNTSRLQATDQAIIKKLDAAPNSHQLAAIEADVEKLRLERRELILRQDFLDRLAFKIETAYAGVGLRDFLKGALRGMARIDLQSNSEHSIWKFLNNLSLLIDEVPERQQNVLSVIEGYMKQTSIENPMRPDEYLASTAYSNGSQAEGARPMDRSSVGEYAEKQLKGSQPAPTPVKTP